MAKGEKDVKGIMEAIQHVLAEHDIDRARVVLELFQKDEPDAPTTAEAGRREVEVVVTAPRREPAESSLCDAPDRVAPKTTPTVTMPVPEMGQPLRSPEKPLALPRMQHHVATEPPRPSSAVPLMQRTETAVATAPTASALPPMSSTGDADSAAALHDTVSALAQTARPSSPEVSADNATVDATAMAADPLNPAALLPESLQRQLAQDADRRRRTEILNSFVGKSVLLESKKQREQTRGGSAGRHFLSALTTGQGGAVVGGDFAGGRHATVTLQDAAQLPRITSDKKKGPAVVGKVPVFGILNKDGTGHEGSDGAATPRQRTSSATGAGSAVSGRTSTVQLLHNDAVAEEEPRRKSDSVSSGCAKQQHVTREHLDSILLTNPSRATDASSPSQAQTAHPTRLGTDTFPALVHSPEVGPDAAPSPNKVSNATAPTPRRHGASGKTAATADVSDSTPGQRKLSLKQMLQEQEKMEQQSREGLAQHAQLMEKARQAILSMEAKNLQQLQRISTDAPSPHSIPPSHDKASAVSTPSLTQPTRSAAAVPSQHSPLQRLNRVADAPSAAPAAAEAPHSKFDTACTTTPLAEQAAHMDTHSAHGLVSPMKPVTPPKRVQATSPRATIQVLNVTLPTETRARTELIEQYSKSPAAAQHISTKDKYAALLTAQQEGLDKQSEDEKEYKKLVEKAVEYNRKLGVKDVI